MCVREEQYKESGSMVFMPIGETASSYKAGTPVLDVCLLVGFLLEAIIAKSQFNGLIGGWRGHMILTVVMLALLLVRGVWIRIREPFCFAPPHPIGTLLAIACVWAAICCILQPNAYANLVFLTVFAANIYVCLYIAPNLVLPYLGERSVLLYALPLFAVNVLNLFVGTGAAPQGSTNWRLAGITDNATHSGALAALGSILALWMLVSWPQRRRMWFFFWGVSMLTLALSRTRSSIIGCALGSTFLLIEWCRRRPRHHLTKLTIGLVFSAVAIMTIVLYRPHLINELGVFFRASGGVETILQSRMSLWQDGVTSVRHRPLFGSGPMAKFDDTNDPTINTYNEKSICGNSLLLFAQSYGVPGALLFALLLIEIVRIAMKMRGKLRLLLLGVILMGVGASISQMWAVSFGAPSDRAVWLILGVALARNRNSDKNCSMRLRHDFRIQAEPVNRMLADQWTVQQS